MLNGPVKVAAIALALLVALLLLDISFSLVSVGINAPGSSGPSEPGTAGDATAGPGENGQAGDASSGSGPGNTPAGDSNPLTGSGGSVPAIPKEVLAPVGLLWWLSGNNGANVPSGAMPSTDVPGGTAGDLPTSTGAGTGTGTNVWPNCSKQHPFWYPEFWPGR